ncbi:MAG TPA: transketolase C-terminal domain-containing protein [Candidatus Latescibacteria bacterium]|nr:transketolase C-terminal domain-containing protein [Candidatus Latescibacterota bacterium]HQI76084.1 transketolase C-terminal domain-containing protein [Candidatus Latescibacterota bacterium]
MARPLGMATRQAYGKALVEIGKLHPNVVVLDADLSKSTMTKDFAKAYPDRFFNVGIAEANLVGVASGLATTGKIPFASSFACFLMCKGFDQLRLGVAYAENNVKIVVSHGGISIGEDGVSQMSVEDVALACELPKMVVMVPSDEHCTYQAIRAAVEHKGPVFVRTGRAKAPLVYDAPPADFAIGKAITVREGKDVTVIANGMLVGPALDAAESLAEQGVSVRVLDMHTVKPLDEEAVLKAAKETKGIVVAEEHLVHGGLGSAVAQVTARMHPARIEFVAIQDTYAESATGEELMAKYGLSEPDVIAAVRRILA